MLTSIRSRLLFLALAGGIICVAIAAYTYTRVERLQSNDQIALVDMAAMHNHMQGDMMHDALRGDVLSAFVGAEIGGVDRAGLESDLRSHSEEFHAMLAANLALPLKPELHSALQDIKPSLESYIASAQNIVALTASDLPKAKAEFPNFQKAFSDLEGRQETVTELIGKTAEADQAATRELFETTRKAMTVAVGIAIAIAVLTAIMGIVYARRILGSIEDTVAVLGAMAQGDLTRRVEVREKNEFGRMAESLNSAIGEMSRAMASVEVASDRMAAASAEVSSATTQLSDGSQQQAAALEETAASLEEITGTVKQNAESARQANQLAVASHTIAEKGGRVVAEAVVSIREISKSSEKIANIISTIDEIAFQTNLLALNAAVEAARAGDQGRGFAVVASEVRTLAKRSASAAKEIKGLIEESLDKVQVGSTLVNRSGESLTEIVASVKRVTDIIAEIAAASEEQATGVEQVNRAVTQMDQVVQSTAGQATELATTSRSLSAQAAELRGLVQQFHLSEESTRTTPTSPSTPTELRAPLAHSPAAPIPRKSALGARGASLRKPVVASKESQSGSDEGGFIEF